MKYEIEELVPIVAELAKKYTGYESTSITYEKAEQLMGAVLYCIQEMELSDRNAIAPREKLSAQQAYEIGYEAVVKKVRSALDIYHDILHGFTGYGNHCLYDTVIKGIPEFFKWYDAEFEPQNTILTLDYPVLKDVSVYSGIDRIYEFLSCIRMEKVFLKPFSEDYIVNVLCRYHCCYQDMVENICEIVYMVVICHILAQKPLSEQVFSRVEEKRIQQVLFQTDNEDLKSQLTEATKEFVGKFYGNNSSLWKYLTDSMDDIMIRLKIAANRGIIE